MKSPSGPFRRGEQRHTHIFCLVYGLTVARKGSVCIDGVSLTINSVSGDSFSVNIIPHTADVTIIGGYEVGTEVNIEVDLLARYLERLLGDSSGTGVTREFLKAHGYVD